MDDHGAKQKAGGAATGNVHASHQRRVLRLIGHALARRSILGLHILFQCLRRQREGDAARHQDRYR
jgi:hypothetical protein